jgi:hypothetical protein
LTSSAHEQYIASANDKCTYCLDPLIEKLD